MAASELRRIGIDTNLLVYAHLPGFAQHEKARDFLQARLSEPETVLVLTPMVLHELVHVVTDPRRFAPPLSMAEALGLVRLYLGRSNVECVPVTGESCALMAGLLERQGLGGSRVADALIAATLLVHGVREVATANAGHFAGMPGLIALDPTR